MARGDECKTASKANNACKLFDITSPIKKPVVQPAPQPSKKPEQKSYGAWGSLYKDKNNFTDMHFC